jgi:cytochrome c553
VLRLGIILAILSALATTARADPALGKAKVQAICSVCHGVNGIGTNPDVPNLAGESVNYLEKQLKAYKSGERQHEQMSIIVKDLSDDDMRNVAEWYSALRVTVEEP